MAFNDGFHTNLYISISTAFSPTNGVEEIYRPPKMRIATSTSFEALEMGRLFLATRVTGVPGSRSGFHIPTTSRHLSESTSIRVLVVALGFTRLNDEHAASQVHNLHRELSSLIGKLEANLSR